ncbi:MAG TPA: S53 family peptidase [Aliidongia sp.]|uniref:S53 family peptidase n=1 Tax=Aliidongia sp. TaxID=1914230 RepID=UPI002DDD47D5|nr:S53 family peptidase [Aliidongia sp.]HEV2675168.1 S53 family peptidase [Aliidongia sp.]
MADAHTAEFPDSQMAPPSDAVRVGPVPAGTTIEVSLYLKRRIGETQAIAGAGDRRKALADHRATGHRDDIQRVRAFAADHGLTVVSVEPARRLVKLSGPISACEAAFGTTLDLYRQGDRQFRARTGTLRLPVELLPIVEAVLGLDDRPAAFAKALPMTGVPIPAGYRPNQIGAFYGFPIGVTGAGQCIAIIELGGGYLDGDNQAAFQAMGLPLPTIVAVPVDGAANAPGHSTAADEEVALDLQVAGGVAPGATLAIYFAPATYAGFVDAVSAAIHDTAHKPSAISISWGIDESAWSGPARQAMDSAFQDAATLRISVFVASGDNLATNGNKDGALHVQYPASSPWAIGCGGTAIATDGQAISSEAAWSDTGNGEGTGGGISTLYPVPDFQKPANAATGRGVPDVAGSAAQPSGYAVMLNGVSKVIGGTSAVAPLWAGLVALINERASQPVGFFLPTLYAEPDLLRPITEGDNKPKGTDTGYAAGPGWNACTGLGVPRGQALFDRFTASKT